ncbi:MAG: hypothetical protein ACRC9R_09170, partial [Enterovibrio sp.]
SCRKSATHHIKSLGKKFSVADFSAAKTEYRVLCRLTNNVEMPDGESFEKYIQNALIEELKMAGAYDPNSDIVIKGHLNDTSVRSGMPDAHWALNLTVANKTGKSFTINHRREYRASFVGGIACRSDMPNSFQPTVQGLINEIINHPQFKELFGSRSK